MGVRACGRSFDNIGESLICRRDNQRAGPRLVRLRRRDARPCRSPLFVNAAATADDEHRACESLLIHNRPPDEPPYPIESKQDHDRADETYLGRSRALPTATSWRRSATANFVGSRCRFGVAPFDARV
jgi:hypothetical protein